MTDFPATLLQGYDAFMSGRYVGERERYRELAEAGQKPETLIIACCDSRVAPEIIFNARPGELFVARNVANLVLPFAIEGESHGTSAAIEFAVEGLGVSNIVVMGHGRCGGVQAALSADFEPLSEGDFVGGWMKQLKPLADEVSRRDDLSSADRQTALERISIRNSLKNLRSYPNIAEAEEAGRLKLHGAWFDISTGELWYMDPETLEFVQP